MKLLTAEQKALLEKHFSAGAADEESESAYWIYGADCGDDYCFKCAEKEVAKLKSKNPNGEYEVDGGWSTDHDGQPFCTDCGNRLEGSYTQYACKSEVDSFLENGFNPAMGDDCWAMNEVISSMGWDFDAEWYSRQSVHERTSAEEYYRNLHELGFRILSKIAP